MNIKKHINMLGYEAEDKITGFKGTVVRVTFDLYGCIQAALLPTIDKKGKASRGEWQDIARLQKIGMARIFTPPKFSSKPKKYIGMLGYTVKDVITGFKGTLSSVHVTVTGEVIGIVTPKADEDGKKQESEVFKVSRLSIVSTLRAMPLPDYDTGPVAEGRHGPAENPVQL